MFFALFRFIIWNNVHFVGMYLLYLHQHTALRNSTILWPPLCITPAQKTLKHRSLSRRRWGRGGRRDWRRDLLYTTLRHVNCNRVVNYNRCWRVGIIAVISIFIWESFPTHHFENFVGDLYGIEIYEPKIQIRFPIYCWKATGVSVPR